MKDVGKLTQDKDQNRKDLCKTLRVLSKFFAVVFLGQNCEMN